MGILIDWEKEYVRNWAYGILSDKSDWKKYANLIELSAAVFIIEKMLGTEWYEKAGKEIHEQSLEDHSKFSTPVSYYLTHSVDYYSKIISFGHFLKELYQNSNIQEKIKEYVKKEQRTDIAKNMFDSLFFEFKIASYFSNKKFKIEFIKESQKSPSPDLKIISKQGYELVECKKKRIEKLDFRSIINTISRANQQLSDYNDYGIIALELPPSSTNQNELADLDNQIKNLFNTLSNTDAILLDTEIIYNIGNDIRGFKTLTETILNSNSPHKIPQDILDSITPCKSSMEGSLLED